MDKFSERTAALSERQSKIDAETAAANELREALSGRLESLEARRKALLLPAKTDKKAAADLEEVRAEVAQQLPQLGSVNNKLGELSALAATLRAEQKQLEDEKLVYSFHQAELRHCEALAKYYMAQAVVETARGVTMMTHEALQQRQAEITAASLPIPGGGFSLPVLSDVSVMAWLNKKIKELSGQN